LTNIFNHFNFSCEC